MIIISNIKILKTKSETNLKLRKEIKYSVLTAIVILTFSIMTIYPDYYILGAKTGIKFCGNILIPSVFPFIFLTSFIVKSGISEKIGKIMSPIIKFLFYLPGCAGPTIILSFLGGYPIGAKGVKNLYEEKLINDEQAERMLYFTVGAGPAFTISAVGVGILKNYRAGCIIFLSQILSIILIGIFLGTRARIKKTYFYVPILNKGKETKNNLTESIIKSSYDASISIVGMCALIIIFCCLISIAKYIALENISCLILSKFHVPNNISKNIIPIALEVTSACTQSINLNLPLETISFAIGWAGLCIHFQIFSIIEGIKISYLKFIFFRIIHGLLSFFITKVFINYYTISTLTFSNFQKIHSLPASTSFLGSISLLITCLCFIITIHKDSEYHRK